MGDVVSFQTTKDEEDNMAELKTIIGGSTPGGSNWLSELEIGTIFLAKDKTSADFSLMCLCLVDKTSKSVKLSSPELPQPRFVDPSRFCQKYMFHETLGLITPEMVEDTTEELPALDPGVKKEDIVDTDKGNSNND